MRKGKNENACEKWVTGRDPEPVAGVFLLFFHLHVFNQLLVKKIETLAKSFEASEGIFR